MIDHCVLLFQKSTSLSLSSSYGAIMQASKPTSGAVFFPRISLYRRDMVIVFPDIEVIYPVLMHAIPA